MRENFGIKEVENVGENEEGSFGHGSRKCRSREAFVSWRYELRVLRCASQAGRHGFDPRRPLQIT